MEKLTREEVLHVAHLARIGISDEEIEKYSVDLKILMNDIDKIKDVECSSTDILVTPVEHEVNLRSDEDIRQVDFDEFKVNLDKTIGRFIEVMAVREE